MSDKIFVGSATKKEFPNGGHVITVHLECDDLEKYFNEFGYINKRGKHVVKLKISQRREVGKFGDTHTVEIDTWKPDSTYSGNAREEKPATYQRQPADRQPTREELDAIDDDRQAKMFPDDIPF